jgi:hypothetical protein
MFGHVRRLSSGKPDLAVQSPTRPPFVLPDAFQRELNFIVGSDLCVRPIPRLLQEG